ncbi:MAG TPA: 5-methyltetrahydropteroyltriglutamate--homocysteine S-methyltransferase, partial [Stellaceae bacterium]|nr:5-methyltetrahydropteroyltriglutamate--homocysteine S-methyltransferase [Stellaceae bacterium]
MTSDGPPFRADHVGSLLRPAALLRAREERAAGRLSAAGLRAAEDEAIREVVALQEKVGLRSATDGEFRRRSWHMDFLYQLGGVSKAQDDLTIRFHNASGGIEFKPSALRVTGRLKLDGCIFGDDFLFLKSIAGPGSTPKLTIPSPSMLHYRSGETVIDYAGYTDMRVFWHDLAEAYSEEL